MKKIRYGRLLIVILLTAYSFYVIFGTESRKETPYERRVRQLEQELSDLAETDPLYNEKEAEVEQARADADSFKPAKLREKAVRLEQELSGMKEGSEEYKRTRNVLENTLRMIPKWYDSFPLNLGLDLRGGTEVRMRIVSERLERTRNTLRDELAALEEGTDAYKAKQKELSEAQSALESNIEDAVDVIRRRLDRSGMSGIPVTQEGENRIRVQLPGMDSATAQTIINRIRLAGRLEFRIVTDLNEDASIKRRFEEIRSKLRPNTFNICFDHGRALKPGEIDKDGLCKTHHSRLYDWLEEAAVRAPDNTVKEPARMHLLRQEEDPLTGAHIRRARADFDPNSGYFAVHCSFDLEGTSRFGRLTTDNTGKLMAIILDKKLVSAPRIREAITGGECQITGNFSDTEARELAVVLKEGSLPVDLEVEMENNVGATLGEDSIAKGMEAILIGLAVVLLFMAAYYLFAGLVTDFCLFLNMAFILAAFIGMHAVLTLPGIAGLILTVGMAVDANVLIFERIREERAKGLPFARALENGYDRAFVTIVDANLTTFITALILYSFGTEAVKGFGTTLIIGIITSMFTSLFVTRTIFHFFQDIGQLKDLKMMEIIRGAKINFVGSCRQAGVASLVIIIAGLVLFISRGNDNYGNDFTGGVLAQPNLSEAIPMSEARGKLGALRETLRVKLEAGLKKDLTNTDLTVEDTDLSEVDLQSYGVPTTEGYASFVLRTRPITYGDKPWAKDVDSGVVAELFSDSFRQAIEETFPVVPGGISAITAVPETTLGGHQVWDFTLNLARERSPREVQDILRTTEMGNVNVRNADAPLPAMRATEAEVTLTLMAGNGDEPLSSEALRGELLAVVKELKPTTLDPESAIGQPARTSEEAPAGKVNLRVTVTTQKSMTADEIGNMLLMSDRITAATATLTSLPAIPQPAATPVRQVKVTCTAKPTDISPDVDVALAEQQFIRSQLGALRSANTIDYTEPFGRFTAVGPLVAGEMQQKAILALIYSMVAIFFYIWLRFQFRVAFGLGACLALVHDVLFTIGAIAAADHFFGIGVKIDLPVVAALLTIVGYSLNDTIVVFDRIRENLSTGGHSLSETINTSVNQTLSRTILTSLTTLLVVICLLVWGGEVIRGFAFALFIGVLVGTYSSIFIASPVLVYMENWAHRRAEKQKQQAQPGS